jgi:Class III cytochrome C family
MEVKRGWILSVIAANMIALIVLVFVYPHLMVAPGPLSRAHAELTTDCFACHALLRGATSGRCVRCHALPDIGLKTSKGVQIVRTKAKSPFHQELTEKNCMACHGDHAGPRLTKAGRKAFAHSLLRAEIRQRCEACHAAPIDNIHRDLTVSCGQCHSSDHWKPATFDHAQLAKAVFDKCESCHKAPADKMHNQISGNCKQCHIPAHWKPATFDHAKSFVLDQDHNATCVTCHTNNDYARYTCYGCHEHQPAKIRSKHLKEGIRDFENCVKCHRSANGEAEGRESHQGRRGD